MEAAEGAVAVVEAAVAVVETPRGRTWQKGEVGKWESGGLEMRRFGGEKELRNVRQGPSRLSKKLVPKKWLHFW